MNLEPSLKSFFQHAIDYSVDSAQRAVLFTDVMRRRGNTYLKHLKQGQPPVLAFDFEMIMDGRRMPQPVNYALVRILDRRKAARRTKRSSRSGFTDDRRCTNSSQGPHPRKRPIVVIDPRAGHGPGIGGSKLDSQIGVALNCGHPVYFILFFYRS